MKVIFFSIWKLGCRFCVSIVGSFRICGVLDILKVLDKLLKRNCDASCIYILGVKCRVWNVGDFDCEWYEVLQAELWCLISRKHFMKYIGFWLWMVWFHSEVGFGVPCLIMFILSSWCFEKRVSWVFKFACLLLKSSPAVIVLTVNHCYIITRSCHLKRRWNKYVGKKILIWSWKCFKWLVSRTPAMNTSYLWQIDEHLTAVFFSPDFLLSFFWRKIKQNKSALCEHWKPWSVSHLWHSSVWALSNPIGSHVDILFHFSNHVYGKGKGSISNKNEWQQQGDGKRTLQLTVVQLLLL